MAAPRRSPSRQAALGNLRAVATPVSDRLSRIGYQRARWLLLGAGLVVLAVVSLAMFVRRVDTVEVVATLLFVPVFLGFLFKGLAGGFTMGLAAAAGYVALRYPAIDAVGASEFAGLIASRSLSYLVFGIVGGLSSRVLEQSLDKLELYDHVDDATNLKNARFFLQQTNLERARAERYKSIFSVVVLEIPTAALAPLGRRRRAAVLRELGRQLSDGLRTVDHVAHANDGTSHRLAAILPETASEGAEVFRTRFAQQVGELLTSNGVTLDQGLLHAQAATLPGDDELLAVMRADFARVDELEHPHPAPNG